METVFKNAIFSIIIGFEDFENSDRDERRILSSVRNIYAGVLLLAKAVLVKWSPEDDPNLLISKNIKPFKQDNGIIKFKSHGRSTINRYGIYKCFNTLDLEIDSGPIDKLAKIRNDIEHKYVECSKNILEEAIIDALPVITDLLRIHLDTTPADELGDTWKSMLKLEKLYKAELSSCRETIKKIEFYSPTVEKYGLVCPKCNTKLIAQENSENNSQGKMKLICRACNEKPEIEQVIVHTLSEATWSESHLRAKETGEDGPCSSCPECENDSYVDFENKCAVCGHCIEKLSYGLCDNSLNLEEINLSETDTKFCSCCNYRIENILQE